MTAAYHEQCRRCGDTGQTAACACSGKGLLRGVDLVPAAARRVPWGAPGRWSSPECPGGQQGGGPAKEPLRRESREGEDWESLDSQPNARPGEDSPGLCCRSCGECRPRLRRRFAGYGAAPVPCCPRCEARAAPKRSKMHALQIG
ncbi:hypothetical protein DIPPA_06858 [Diplonema papillatum]|nr:hypothetical protein DIPPA_06858 [Diplonema papillatum]